ncbi:MAG: FAD-dependent oxidoreductase [Bacteroidales bacterium]|nr:FAD-dependent oxidoreductase [Bacteroidales bacterium]
MKTNFDYVIIGAGIAGTKAIEGIRSIDSVGSILLINGEQVMPYKRTRLSKELLAPFDPAAHALHPDGWYEELGVCVLNEKVNSITLLKNNIRTPNNGTISYKKLIVATGGTPVVPVLKGGGKQFLLPFRNAADAALCVSNISEMDKILIVGGGSLGVELASVFSEAGKTVSLVHTSSSLVNHCFDQKMSFHLQDMMINQGVRLILQDELRSVSQTGNGKLLVSIGEMIHLLVDRVIVAAGIKPEIGLATKAGLATEKGILVDERMQTSHPNVFAAGDVAQLRDGQSGGLWHQAEYQGWIAGVNAAGGHAVNDGRSFRLKVEAFGQYYFALNIHQGFETVSDEVFQNNGSYLRFFYHHNQLAGVAMYNLKQLAKRLEQAVNEGWSHERVKAEFNSIDNHS